MALEAMLARKRLDVAERKAAEPLESWVDSLVPSERELKLGSGPTGYILECKSASPSEGQLRTDFDPAAISRSYAPFASAISVLTDGPYFGGSFEHLRAVRSSVELPVLCKDFVTEPYQIYEARRHGADVVLLMLSVLDDDGWRACAEVARRYALDVLTEVHDRTELQRALALGAPLIGINNRNLADLKIDLSTTEALAGLVPPGIALISESGIRTREDVRRLRPRVGGFLIGSSLMKAESTEVAVRELIFGRVKVCGLTRLEDAQAAWLAGASWGGLIFHPDSPRYVDRNHANQLTAVPLQWAGVFVNHSPGHILELVEELGLRAVQLHGEETPHEVEWLRDRLPYDCELWQAFRVQDSLPQSWPSAADRLVLDTFREGARGGTGERWSWELLRDWPFRDRALLSGGLTPELADAADALGCWALDVSSGVEDQPGHKSPSKLDAFFEALRGGAVRPLPVTP